MSVDNLPAVRTSNALAAPTQPTRQPPAPAPAPVHVPAPLRLSTALAIVSAIAASLAGLSAYVGRNQQAALVGGIALVLLFAAAVERHREHRT